MSQLSKQKSQSDGHVSEDKFRSFPVYKQISFKWNNSKKKLALLRGMIHLKPAGVNKHLNVLLIREEVSKNLKIYIPTISIWNYIESNWNIDRADYIESNSVTHHKGFDLPKDKEWKELIEEQNKLWNLNDKKKDPISQAAVSNVDLKTLKSVKVMVEKLDSRNLLINCLKLNNILNWEKTLKNGPNDFQLECTSSNPNKGIKRKLPGRVALNEDNKMHENIVNDQSSTDIMLRKNSRYTFINSNKKKKYSTNISNLKQPIFRRSTSSSYKL